MIPGAHKLDEITYDEMLELATLGAQVLHNRSVEMAKKYNVNLEVLSSLYRRNPGTKIKEAVKVEKMLIRGVARDNDVARISIIGVPDQPGIAFKIFSQLAAKKVNVDIILQSIGRDDTKDISFTVDRSNKQLALELMEDINERARLRASIIATTTSPKSRSWARGCSPIPASLPRCSRRCSEANVNIQMISTSEIKISVLVALADGERAVSAIHDAFDL